MRRVIKKFLSKKRNVAFLAVFFAAIAGSSAYTLMGISENLQKMVADNTSAAEATPYFPEYPPLNLQGKNPELIKRGEYLTKAGDCMACHTNTPVKGKQFAGGLPMPTPFGTIYSPNITPDKETGIGNWTDEQFIKAMHKGISPEGHYYYPAFPYIYFSKVSESDLKAIKAYLDSIPAVHQPNRKNMMIWPFNRRLLQLPWRFMFFHPDRKKFEVVPHGTDQWKRGQYLVEGLGHCAMCHTPSYHIFSDNLSLGAPMETYDLTGAKIQGYLAPNISKSNLANVSTQEIVEVFTKDNLIGGGKIKGPMLEVNHDSLKYLSQEDLTAIAVYLKSVQSKSPPKPSGKGAGKATYEMYCSGCHASGAGGAPKYGDGSAWEPLMKAGIDKVYTHAIQGIGGMPAKGTCLSCSDGDIKQAVDYMVASITGPGGKMTRIPKQKKLTLEDGKRIYIVNCSICHDNGFKNAPKPGDVQAWKPIVDNGFLQAYETVLEGKKGHAVRGACPSCTDADVKAAVKYMMQESAPGKDYSLW